MTQAHEPWSWENPMPVLPARMLPRKEQKRTGHLFAGCPLPLATGDTKASNAPEVCPACLAVMDVCRAETDKWRGLQVAEARVWQGPKAPAPVVAPTSATTYATPQQVSALVVLSRRKRPEWFARMGEGAVRLRACGLTTEEAGQHLVRLSATPRNGDQA